MNAIDGVKLLLIFVLSFSGDHFSVLASGQSRRLGSEPAGECEYDQYPSDYRYMYAFYI